jgi:glutamate-1-semialdehyde aminotransferase
VGRIRRGGYLFLSWKGDHAPRHVHVYKDGTEVLKWNLDAGVAMHGHASRRVLRLIAELEEKGRL